MVAQNPCTVVAKILRSSRYVYTFFKDLNGQKHFGKDFDIFLIATKWHAVVSESRLERPDDEDSNVIDMKEDDYKLYINVDPVLFLSFDRPVLLVTRLWIDRDHAGSKHFAIILHNIFA